MILLIDNYDSFVFNIYQYLSELGQNVKVYRNDQISIEDIRNMKSLRAIVLSPGPGNPKGAGICLEVLESFHKSVPILGICLGHQVIGEFFGGRVIRAKRQLHGKSSVIKNNGKGIFTGLSREFTIIRYHSLMIEKNSLPISLNITATSDDGLIMGLQHRKYKIFGLQFHPESYMSENGHAIFNNFLKQIK